MRKMRTASGLTVNAIAGTHVVMLGLDLSTSPRKGCLGFAIQREDHTEDEKYWLTGTKTFEATDPGLGPGGQASSREHPFQTFQWSDYSAKPDHDYTFKVLPLYGTPKKLKVGGPVSVRLRTEPETGPKHSVFFNRGAIASQEYARRFLNRDPSKVGPAAYKWLSRGLFEAFEAFVGRAKGKTFGLFGAIYEFQWPDALKAIKAAAATGADVHILYDGIPGGSGPQARNEAAIAAAGIQNLCRPRTTGKIMHNKFFVLTKSGKPIAVWTGSTNLTENGIFGHSNVGHSVEDPDLAKAYMDYWNELSGNPASAAEKSWMAKNNPAPPDPWNTDLLQICSPRSGLKVLEWYASIANGLATGMKKPLFMTFAFGMHKDFQSVYEQNDGVLRVALMEKEGTGAGLAQGKIDITRIRKLPNVIVAVGNSIILNSFDRWLAERRALSSDSNVRYVHTKYMLVDPLGPDPTIVTGSANFSEASTDENNENMVVLHGDKRAADIYLGEFMRLYSHYAFREAVARAQEQAVAGGGGTTGGGTGAAAGGGAADSAGTDPAWNPKYLIPNDGWQKDYFKPGGQRFLRRLYFAGK